MWPVRTGNLQNYTQWAGDDSTVMLPVEEAVPLIMEALGSILGTPGSGEILASGFHPADPARRPPTRPPRPERDTAQAMSQENVERLRAMYEAFNRRDWDALFRHTDLEFAFTYRNAGRTPDSGTRRGRDEVVAFAEEYGSAFDSLIWNPEEFFDREDRVVALGRSHASSGWRRRPGDPPRTPLDDSRWRCCSLESFPEPESALEAAELEE